MAFTAPAFRFKGTQRETKQSQNNVYPREITFKKEAHPEPKNGQFSSINTKLLRSSLKTLADSIVSRVFIAT